MIFTFVYLISYIDIDIFVLFEKKEPINQKLIIARNLDYRDASTRILVPLFAQVCHNFH